MAAKVKENYTKTFDKRELKNPSTPAAEFPVTFDESSNPLQRACFGYRAKPGKILADIFPRQLEHSSLGPPPRHHVDVPFAPRPDSSPPLTGLNPATLINSGYVLLLSACVVIRSSALR